MVGRGWKGGDTMVVCVGAGEAQRIRTGDKGWVQPHSTPHTDTHPPKKWGKCPRLSASMDLVQPREHPLLNRVSTHARRRPRGIGGLSLGVRAARSSPSDE